MSRLLLRSVLELRSPLVRLPSAFLLPSRALSTTTATTTTTIPPQAADITPLPYSTTPQDILPLTRHTRPHTLKNTPAPPSPAESAESVAHLFPLMRAQPNHYVTIHIHGRPYLVTEGDRIRLSFKMNGVLPGDVLRLDRATVLGSRDYTLKGSPWIDPTLYECRATVVGVESEPLRKKEKTKRRNRKTKTVKSKHKYTILRISELKLLGPEA